MQSITSSRSYKKFFSSKQLNVLKKNIETKLAEATEAVQVETDAIKEACEDIHPFGAHMESGSTVATINVHTIILSGKGKHIASLLEAKKNINFLLHKIPEKQVVTLQQVFKIMEKEDVYGVCAKCKNLIQHKRLKAVPSATTCCSCKNNK